MSKLFNRSKNVLNDKIKKQESGENNSAIKINKSLKNLNQFQGISSGVIAFVYLVLVIIIAFIRYFMTRIKKYQKDMTLPKANFKPYILVPILIVLFTVF